MRDARIIVKTDVAVPLFLIAVYLAAGDFPTRCATKVDPVAALRSE